MLQFHILWDKAGVCLLIPVFLLYSLDIQGNNDWWILGEHLRIRMGNLRDDHYTNQGLVGF